VVDLDGLLRRPDSYPVEDASVSVWGDDRALMARAEAELRKRGVPVNSLTTQAQARQVLDDTPAAWALSLAFLVGGAGLLVAALVMVVVTATTWRSRAADLAALKMAGVSGRSLRRLERLAALPVVLVGCLAGAGCGVVAAHFALPDVRQFTEPPAVSTIDYSVPWLLVSMATLATVVTLGALALVTSAWTVRRSDLARVRQAG
jgi:putative ABC transport system permease protein